jgi:hypothetical protein
MAVSPGTPALQRPYKAIGLAGLTKLVSSRLCALAPACGVRLPYSQRRDSNAGFGSSRRRSVQPQAPAGNRSCDRGTKPSAFLEHQRSRCRSILVRSLMRTEFGHCCAAPMQPEGKTRRMEAPGPLAGTSEPILTPGLEPSKPASVWLMKGEPPTHSVAVHTCFAGNTQPAKALIASMDRRLPPCRWFGDAPAPPRGRAIVRAPLAPPPRRPFPFGEPTTRTMATILQQETRSLPSCGTGLRFDGTSYRA